MYHNQQNGKLAHGSTEDPLPSNIQSCTTSSQSDKKTTTGQAYTYTHAYTPAHACWGWRER